MSHERSRPVFARTKRSASRSAELKPASDLKSEVYTYMARVTIEMMSVSTNRGV